MANIFEHLVSSVWNFVHDRRKNSKPETSGLSLGLQVTDEAVTRRSARLSSVRRTTHIAVLGKTGTGKSSLLRSMGQQDIAAGRGFFWFDLHGDATRFLLRSIAAQERKLQRHLSDRVVLISPSDRDVSVGFNPLEQETPDIVRIAEFAAI